MFQGKKIDHLLAFGKKFSLLLNITPRAALQHFIPFEASSIVH